MSPRGELAFSMRSSVSASVLWCAGTVATAISVYPNGALVEVSDEVIGEAFDMLDIR
jgi:hypothetical protein